VVYTHVEPDICKGETFKETFLQPSCECCGSEEHAMLTQSDNPHDRTGFKYLCPVATYKRLDKNYPRYPINLDFYACPTKFVEIHHHVNDERLMHSLERYRTQSAARLNYSYSQDFVNEVIRLCEEYQLSHHFKRRKLNESDDEKEELELDQATPPQEIVNEAPTEQRSPQLNVKEEEG